jgi:hypothetical protein
LSANVIARDPIIRLCDGLAFFFLPLLFFPMEGCGGVEQRVRLNAFEAARK